MQLGLGCDPHMCQMVTGREGICEEALEIRVVGGGGVLDRELAESC